ncbi:MAG: antitoxin [Gammaproteobacteria bacterium]|nr:antitoxin [Gammaproteobacteria bacterium]
MKKYQLDQEEQGILSAFEAGELQPIPNSQAEVTRLTKLFKAAGNKTNRVSLRMSENDYLRAKEVALREGLPYQTLLSSILHKYFTGQFAERKSAVLA